MVSKEARLRISASIGGVRHFEDDYLLAGEYEKVDLIDVMEFLREAIRDYREEMKRLEGDKH